VRLFAELILLAQGGLSQEHYAGAVLRCAHVITAFARLVSEVDTRPNPATCTRPLSTPSIPLTTFPRQRQSVIKKCRGDVLPLLMIKRNRMHKLCSSFDGKLT